MFFRKKNVVFVDPERKILFVRKIDNYAMKMMHEGWHVEETGELKFMSAEYGTLVKCSPPFGANGRYATASHCIDSSPLYARCYGAGCRNLKIERVEVIDRMPLIQYNPVLCLFRNCVNKYDFALIDRGVEKEMPDLILSFGNASGKIAGFTPTPYYTGNPVGSSIYYVAYDYMMADFVEINAKIIGKGVAYVSNNGKIYAIEAYIAYSKDKVIARPGYSGSGAFVLD